jgi:hypothetical protein
VLGARAFAFAFARVWLDETIYVARRRRSAAAAATDDEGRLKGRWTDRRARVRVGPAADQKVCAKDDEDV